MAGSPHSNVYVTVLIIKLLRVRQAMMPFVLIINHRDERVLCFRAVVNELRCPFVIGKILNGFHLVQRVLFSASTTIDEWIDFDFHFS